MNYEYKEFSFDDYEADMKHGWFAAYRTHKDYADLGMNKGELELVFLPHFAKDKRIIAVSKRTGDVTDHDAQGRFNPKQGETVLDLVMAREVSEVVEYHGEAWLNNDGSLAAITIFGMDLHVEEGEMPKVPCTLTYRKEMKCQTKT